MPLLLCFDVSTQPARNGHDDVSSRKLLLVERSLELRRVIGRKSSPRNERQVLEAKIKSSKREVSPKVGWHIETKVCWVHPRG